MLKVVIKDLGEEEWTDVWKYSLVPRLHCPAFLAPCRKAARFSTRCEKSWAVEPGNEAMEIHIIQYSTLQFTFIMSFNGG